MGADVTFISPQFLKPICQSLPSLLLLTPLLRLLPEDLHLKLSTFPTQIAPKHQAFFVVPKKQNQGSPLYILFLNPYENPSTDR
jgi:hypothetical protein